MILPATAEHIPACVALGRRLHDESPRWSALPYDEGLVADLASQLIERGGLFIATVADEVVGFAGAVVIPHFFCDVLQLADIAIYILPQHRGGRASAGLLHAMEAWGKGLGATESCVGSHSSTDIERTGAWFERMGYERCGLDYRKAL